MMLIRVLLYRIIDVYFLLLLVYALMSWFPGAEDSTIGRIVRQLVEPVLRPFRRLNLYFAGLDFTVWIVMVGLNFLKQLL